MITSRRAPRALSPHNPSFDLHLPASVSLGSELILTNAMREQSAWNESDSATLGWERERFYTQAQLALHEERDRAEARRDYNEGLAEGAAGMAELELNGTFGDVAAAATLRAQHAATYVDHLNAMARELPTE